jgi:serine/threonine protein kinase
MTSFALRPRNDELSISGWSRVWIFNFYEVRLKRAASLFGKSSGGDGTFGGKAKNQSWTIRMAEAHASCYGVNLAGSAFGVPGCLFPGQALSSGEDIDTRTDVYSLGVIFYELLAGSTPPELSLPGTAIGRST